MKSIIFLFLFSASLLWGDTVRTLAVAPTPEPNTVSLRIAVPSMGQVVNNPVWVQFRVNGFALGAASQFERASEIAVSDMGQTIHIVVDDKPYFAVNEPAIDPFDESGNYYDTSYKVKIPYHLSQGSHTIRMFPARSFKESLKGENCFAALQFYVGGEKGGEKVDLSAPYLTYNEPSPSIAYKAGKPVLLDFYISNTELSPDGYKVRLSVDGKFSRNLSYWVPYYIYGMKPGRHTVRLELLDHENKKVPGPFGEAEETITVR